MLDKKNIIINIFSIFFFESVGEPKEGIYKNSTDLNDVYNLQIKPENDGIFVIF